jgi:hypothetical protein
MASCASCAPFDLLAKFLGFSRAYWKYVSFFEVYCASVFTLVVILYILMRYKPTVRWTLLLAVAHVFSMVIHAYNALLVVAILAAIVIRCRAESISWKSRSLIYLFTAFALGLILYVGIPVFFGLVKKPSDFYGFLFGYLDPKFGAKWWSFSIYNIKVTIRTVSQAFAMVTRSHLMLIVPFAVWFVFAKSKKAFVDFILDSDTWVAVLAFVTFAVFFSVWDVGNDEFAPQYLPFLWFLIASFINKTVESNPPVVSLAPLIYGALLCLVLNFPDRYESRYGNKSNGSFRFLKSNVLFHQICKPTDQTLLSKIDFNEFSLLNCFFKRSYTQFDPNDPELETQVWTAVTQAKGRTFIGGNLLRHLNQKKYFVKTVIPYYLSWGIYEISVVKS